MKSKIDRRKKYTIMVLKESLISLLNEKPISAITVKEICQTADINRSTFYTHYSDQRDLLYQIEAEIIEEMRRHLSECQLEEEAESVKMIEKLLEYIGENKDICYTLLHQHTGTSFEQRVMDVAKQFLMSHKLTDDPALNAYLSTFIISGAIHVTKDWLANNAREAPKQIAEIINEFTARGLSCLDL